MGADGRRALRARAGDATRSQILSVALDLFTREGFEGTSIRDIAQALGMTKSSLYYHFAGKDQIAASLLADRRAELDDLVEWISAQPGSSDLVRRAALRWLDSATPSRVQGLRFARANQPVIRRLAVGDDDIRGRFDRVVDALLPATAPAEDRVLVRMAFDTLGATILAAEHMDLGFPQLLAIARAATTALTRDRTVSSSSGSIEG